MANEINGVDVQFAKDEINVHITNMHIGAFVIGATILVLYSNTLPAGDTEHKRIILMACVSLIGLVGQVDHKIFRIAHWIRYVENFRGSHTGERPIEWETRKAGLRSRKIMMPIFDLLLGAGPLYVLYRVAPAAFATDPLFVGVTIGLIVFGFVALIIGQKEW